MLKGLIHQEDIRIVYIYVPNIEAPKYIKEILTEQKGEINSNTVIVEDTNTPRSTMEIIQTPQKKKKKKLVRNSRFKQTKWTSQTYIKQSIKQQQNTHSSQGSTERLLG